MKTKFHAGSEPIKKLRAIQHYFDGVGVNPILAGGALRDDYMGKNDEINDYDYFIKDIASFCKNKNVDVEAAVELLIKQAFPNHDDAVQLYETDYIIPGEDDVSAGPNEGSHAQVTSVWEIDESGVTYQLIFTKHDPVVHVEKYFDIGFCKVYCDGKRIRYTDDFLYDVKHRRFTIVGDEMTKEQVEYAVHHHADKLEWKYDHTIAIPPRYQKYFEGCGYPTS